MKDMIERETRIDERKATHVANAVAEAASGKPTLFQCRVRKVHDLFDGPKSLKGVAVGDIVDIIEEGIGPGNAYNLCRHTPAEEGAVSTSSVGWFPMTCLEKLSH